jgi:hypothetical protein
MTIKKRTIGPLFYALVYRLLITALHQSKDQTRISLWTYEFLFRQTIQQYRFANASALT